MKTNIRKQTEKTNASFTDLLKLGMKQLIQINPKMNTSILEVVSNKIMQYIV